ncbi:sodium:proton antiporter [Paracoccus liaowanqingii]|uniref:Sodium:proton antiporter n=1 Tax=Paracoccus liaowanqingii TaxID=2560053 RepID=A0A4Z1BWT9_9RHOB|nr:sodium:proton antiporter [Paracoccus liaowanqingii]TGN50225.1 sodium:proton antiporter [Paracoccus liaowanqingii]
MDGEMVPGLSPVQVVALVGVLGVGAQWLAWRFKLPAIVLMLGIGLLVGPVFGLFLPDRDLGPIYRPLIAVAVAIILFEGGLTLDYGRLGDSRSPVQRLVYLGAPLGWALSALVLWLAVGLSWQSAAVFGGVMVVTGPTVIAPMLRQARLRARPAQILQWEAIVNDPIGVLIAVLVLEVVLVLETGLSVGAAAWLIGSGIGFAAALGWAAGRFMALAFTRAWVPEYMKVPVLFVGVIAVFAATDSVLHETGLLAVTIMGMVLANAKLSSYAELHRFKEHATILLVSGVFVLMAASLDFATLGELTWRAALFVIFTVALARPLQVLIPLIGTKLPMNERWLIALTGPRGVVMVAVSGLFGDKLVEAGIADGAALAPLAFIIVLSTVVIHGFTLAPLARRLGLSGADRPGLLLVGGSPFAVALAQALKKAGVDTLVADTNRQHLTKARQAGIPTYYGDILGETAEHQVEFIAYPAVLAASDNDAYNTLVATDLGPHLGRDAVWQISRERDHARHALPAQLGGQRLEGRPTFQIANQRLAEGWTLRSTRLTEEYDMEDWAADRPGAEPFAVVSKTGSLRFATEGTPVTLAAGDWITAFLPPEQSRAEDAPAPEIAAEAADVARDHREKGETTS